MQRHLLLFFLLPALLPISAYAIKVQGLYEAEVPVSDQRPESTRPALKTALQIVLVKVTGDRFAPGRPALATILQRPDNYVQQYRYKTVERAADAAGEEAETALRLWVRFDRAALNSRLRLLGVPVWGEERPSTLIWLAVQDETGRHLVNPEEHADLLNVVEQRARRRGIALLFPLVDLDDSALLRASDIWGGFQGPVLEASRRYQADAILTGSISSTSSGIWEGRWLAYLQGQTATWFGESDLRDAVLDEGIDGLADRLAAQFARASAGLNTIRISVASIFSAGQYAQTLKYLESLSAVAEVQVTAVVPGKVTFMLTAHGGEAALTQAIALGSTLEAVMQEEGAYRLLP